MHFLAILDFGVGFNLASKMDDKNGEATSAYSSPDFGLSRRCAAFSVIRKRG